MAQQTHLKTYTITDLQVAAYAADGDYSAATLIDVPGIQSCQVTVANDAVELRGDNAVIAVVDQGNTLEWQMGAGGISLEALEAMFGGTLTAGGITPDGTKTYDLKATDQRPYFTFVGVTPDDGAGENLHIVVWKAKATGNLELQAADQEFMAPSFSGRGIARELDDSLLHLIQNETAADAAIPSAA